MRNNNKENYASFNGNSLLNDASKSIEEFFNASMMYKSSAASSIPTAAALTVDVMMMIDIECHAKCAHDTGTRQSLATDQPPIKNIISPIIQPQDNYNIYLSTSTSSNEDSRSTSSSNTGETDKMINNSSRVSCSSSSNCSVTGSVGSRSITASCTSTLTYTLPTQAIQPVQRNQQNNQTCVGRNALPFGGFIYTSALAFGHHTKSTDKSTPINAFTDLKPFPLPSKSKKKKHGKTTRKKSVKELPIAKPLSAYNFFFKYEWERIIKNPDTFLKEGPDYTQWDMTFQTEYLNKYWSRDRTIKRKHRKTDGPFSFHELSTYISSVWSKLPRTAKDVWKQISARDHLRYKHEIAILEQQQQTKN